MTDLITDLEEQLTNATTSSAKIQVMNQLAEELHYSQLDRAHTFATQAYALASQSTNNQDPLELADSLCNLGYLNLRKGESETAVNQLFNALTLYRQQQNIAGEAKATGKIGLTFSHIGNYPQALNYHHAQLKLSLKNNLHHEEALAHNGIGIVHSYSHKYQEALNAFQKSLQLSKDNHDIRQQAIILANCAYCANSLEQYQEALTYGQQSLQLALEINNIISASHARIEIAKTYLLLKEYNQSLQQLQINLAQLNSSEYISSHSETLLALGHLYNQWQKPEFALSYLQQALDLSHKVNSSFTAFRCHKEISITYQQKKEFAQALEHFQQFHNLKEKAFNEQTAANLLAIEINYQIEATQQEKALLQAKNMELEKLVQDYANIEVELEIHQNHLEELIAKRTDRLQKKNKELERFTYTVSHDLKSPLITIRGFLGLLERDIQNGDQTKIKRNIERIDLASERMLQLLQDLLELSKIGYTANTLVHIPLQAIILEARDLVTGHIKENNVTLTIEDNLPDVYGDYPRLVEVFQNLIENGCKFMGSQSKPQITVGAKEENGEILCFVKDNGIGISPIHQERIFNLFERLDQKISGTGIGLALVKRIVEYHNGRIWVESEGNNTGSTFYFTLKDPTPDILNQE